MLNKRTLLLVTPILLSACTLGPNFIAFTPNTDDAFASDTEQASAKEVMPAWWEIYNDPTLVDIINEAAKHNHNYTIALASLDEAHALRGVSRGALFPSLSFGGDAARSKSSRLTGTSSGDNSVRNNFNADLDASWEIDLFGKNRRSLEAASARVNASNENARYVLLSITSEVARNYFEVRGLQKRIHVLEKNVDLLNEVEKLAKAQFKTGLVTEFDVSRARGEREETSSRIPNLQAEMQAGIYRLSVLAGKEPQHYLSLFKKEISLPSPPDIVPVGLRSDILRRRPDVKLAEAQVAEASAAIGVATAELFPSISLTGAIGSSARLFGDLFTSGASTFSFGSSLAAPIFQGGALRAELEATKAAHQASLAHYEKTVLEALEDAESSLIRYGKEWQTLSQLRAALASRKEGFRIAKLRYQAGEENFLVILDAERSLINIQDSVIQSETRLLTSLTQLYKALGGGWETLEETAQKSREQ